MAVNVKGWNRKPAWYKGKGIGDPGLRHGFRSGLEEQNAKHLTALGAPVIFELVKIKYVVPSIERTYTVDFELPNGILVETKGKFEPVDRAKHLFIKLQHPDLDIRFVFQRPNEPISKGSKTTHAKWAEKHGFKWAAKLVPAPWIKEPGPGAKGPRTIPVSDAARNLMDGPARQPHRALHKAAD